MLFYRALIDYFVSFSGSGALPGKMLLVRIIEIINLMFILGQVRLINGWLCPAGVGI